MKKAIILILIFSISKVYGGDVEFPPMIDINPNNITPTTEIQVGYNLFQPTCLFPASNSQGQTHLTEIDGNNITLTFIAVAFSPCTILPIPDYEYFNIGTLPEGEYTITLFRSFPVPLPVDPNDPNIAPIQYGDPITFGVSSPQTVPALSIFNMFLLIIVVLFIAIKSIKTHLKRSHIVILLCFFTIQSEAAVYHVLLSPDTNAPTADEIPLNL